MAAPRRLVFSDLTKAQQRALVDVETWTGHPDERPNAKALKKLIWLGLVEDPRWDDDYKLTDDGRRVVVHWQLGNEHGPQENPMPIKYRVNQETIKPIARENPGADYHDEIVDAMARLLFVDAYSNALEERDDMTGSSQSLGEALREDWPAAGGGENWMDVAPETPPQAYAIAKELASAFEHRNNLSLGGLLDRAAQADGMGEVTVTDRFDEYAEEFGENLAFMALGHGVSWFDDHEKFPIRVPRIEVHLNTTDEATWDGVSMWHSLGRTEIDAVKNPKLSTPTANLVKSATYVLAKAKASRGDAVAIRDARSWVNQAVAALYKEGRVADADRLQQELSLLEVRGNPGERRMTCAACGDLTTEQFGVSGVGLVPLCEECAAGDREKLTSIIEFRAKHARPLEQAKAWYVSTFCNFPHRLSDGKPVQHECRIIPPAALQAERAGNTDEAIRIMQATPAKMMRRGVKNPGRSDEDEDFDNWIATGEDAGISYRDDEVESADRHEIEREIEAKWRAKQGSLPDDAMADEVARHFEKHRHHSAAHCPVCQEMYESNPRPATYSGSGSVVDDDEGHRVAQDYGNAESNPADPGWMKIKQKLNMDELAAMLDLPSWESVDELNQDYYAEARGADDEEESYKNEERVQKEVFEHWKGAVLRAAEELFELHELSLVEAGLVDWERKIMPLGLGGWKKAAKQIMETVNGVGNYTFSSLKEFLDSGPYTERQAVLANIGYIARYPEVYGSTSAKRIYDSAWGR